MRAITLLYHDVVPDGQWASSGFLGADADLYKLDCAHFGRHLDAIGRALPDRMTTGVAVLANPPKDRACMLTFDDGGESALLHTADMLEERGWRGHFFVTAGRIGTPGFLDRRQIQELHRRRHVIGSHSYSHPTRMALCSRAQLDEEWRSSVEILNEILGEAAVAASVPGGFYSREVAASAAEAGIELLFNSEPVTRSQTVDGCLVLGRFGAQRATPPEWSAAIVGGKIIPRFREYAFWNTKKLAKTVLGNSWLKARKRLLERREP